MKEDLTPERGKIGTEKIKFALRITLETQKLGKDFCSRDNCQSQNEFIDKAIRFYTGYLSVGVTW